MKEKRTKVKIRTTCIIAGSEGPQSDDEKADKQCTHLTRDVGLKIWDTYLHSNSSMVAWSTADMGGLISLSAGGVK